MACRRPIFRMPRAKVRPRWWLTMKVARAVRCRGSWRMRGVPRLREWSSGRGSDLWWCLVPRWVPPPNLNRGGPRLSIVAVAVLVLTVPLVRRQGWQGLFLWSSRDVVSTVLLGITWLQLADGRRVAFVAIRRVTGRGTAGKRTANPGGVLLVSANPRSVHQRALAIPLMAPFQGGRCPRAPRALVRQFVPRLLHLLRWWATSLGVGRRGTL